MTLFSSRPPFNDDPRPYLHPSCPDHPVCRRSFDWPEYHDPRPEYERPQHNPTNRLLTAARRALADGCLADFCEGFLAERNTEHSEIDHAQRVLTRLANLQKEPA